MEGAQRAGVAWYAEASVRETEVGGAARCFRQTRSNQRGSMRGVPPHMNVRVAYPRFPSTAFACPHAKAGATRKGRMAEKLYACVRGPGLGHDRAASRPAAAAHWCARRRPRVALTVLLDTSAEVTLCEIVPALVVVEAGGKRARRVPARIQAAVWALRHGTVIGCAGPIKVLMLPRCNPLQANARLIFCMIL